MKDKRIKLINRAELVRLTFPAKNPDTKENYNFHIQIPKTIARSLINQDDETPMLKVRLYRYSTGEDGPAYISRRLRGEQTTCIKQPKTNLA